MIDVTGMEMVEDNMLGKIFRRRAGGNSGACSYAVSMVDTCSLINMPLTL